MRKSLATDMCFLIFHKNSILAWSSGREFDEDPGFFLKSVIEYCQLSPEPENFSKFPRKSEGYTPYKSQNRPKWPYFVDSSPPKGVWNATNLSQFWSRNSYIPLMCSLVQELAATDLLASRSRLTISLILNWSIFLLKFDWMHFISNFWQINLQTPYFALIQKYL